MEWNYKALDDFGKDKWICECGEFYYIIDGCVKCHSARMMTIMARKRVLNRLNGLPNKAAQKRAKKALHSRIVNLFKSGEVEKGQKMLDNLKKKSTSRWSHVNRLMKKTIGR